ncbi:MAG TPA: polysaccharide biosynthesis C-terminal domain-containing protein, partial [Pseudogracilibacillus sp.]|nr:polysaccharide biosynthesis C-terminal domain-containing protein [Pseudogracilibacillus sp.]
KGSIIATGLAIGVAVFINLWRIQRAAYFSYKKTLKRTLFMVIFSMIMWIVIYVTKWLGGFFLPYEESRFAATVMLIIGVAVGGIFYLWLTYKSTLMEYVLGSTRFLNRFRRKKSAD